MARLIILTRDGTRTETDAFAGANVMEIIRDAGIDEMPALCGGCCSCSTCHVKIDPAFLALMPAMSGDEEDLLEAANERDASSRLSCQITFEDKMDGLTVTVMGQD